MFVWYSNSTKESGEALAQALYCAHGTVPPQGYEGDVICLGAAQADNFNWNNRQFTKVVNDPRKYRKYANKATLKQTLGTALKTAVRIFWLNEEIVSIINKDTGQPFPVENLNLLTVIIQALVEKLDNPDFIAIDGNLSDTAFVASNVVTGPSILGQQTVIDKFVATYEEDPDVFFKNVIDQGSKDEKKALINIFKKIQRGLV